MERPILSARGAAGYLEALDNVLLLTHVRPDGDTIGSAAALCRALRDCGQTAYLLPNPEITATYAPYAAPYWAPEDWEAEHIVSVDIADVSLLPENAKPYQERIELAVDHHPSQTFFARNTCLEADSAACGEIVHDIIALLTAVYMFRASGAMEYLGALLAPALERVGIPPEVAPLLFIRPISGSGALAVGSELMATYGPDSYIGRVAAVMLGSSETTFYTIAVYFGSVGIVKTRYTIPASLCADAVMFLTSAAAVRVLMG